MPTRDLDGNPVRGGRPIGPLSGGSSFIRPQDLTQPDRYVPRRPGGDPRYAPVISAAPRDTRRGDVSHTHAVTSITATPLGRKAMKEHVTDLTLLDIAILAHSCAPTPPTPVQLIVAVRKERGAPSLDPQVIFKRIAVYAQKGWLALTYETTGTTPVVVEEGS